MKIDIEIKDISLFAQVAVIVDRPQIINGIIQLRNKWTKGKIYPTVKAWKSSGIKINFHKDILDFLDANNISPVFLSVIEQAIVTNKVTSFTRVVRIPIPRKVITEYYPLIEETIQNGDYEYVLITPAEAERVEVEEAYADMKRAIKATAEVENPFEQLLQPRLQNPKSAFRNSRDWYWMYLEEKDKGRGIYSRILNKWNVIKGEELSVFDQNIIEQAVSNYQKLLKR